MKKRLALNSMGHFLVDAACAAAVFGPVAASARDLAGLIILYNTLAFSTQCIVGLLTDNLGKHERLAGAALAVTALGLALPLPPAVRIVVVGIGNSFYHVAAGTVTIKDGAGKAAPLGIFVAPGALGLVVGKLCCGACMYIAVPALAVAAVQLTSLGEEARERAKAGAVPWAAVAALLLAVAVRAIGGCSVNFPWKSGAAAAAATAVFVFAGKMSGGFVCDKIGVPRTAWVSMPLAALLTVFCAGWAVPSLIGQLLLNLTMPVSLWLLCAAMPDSPGFAFGLAASALWPGTLIGGYISLTGTAAALLTAFCFMFGLAAVLYSFRRIRRDSE